MDTLLPNPAGRHSGDPNTVAKWPASQNLAWKRHPTFSEAMEVTPKFPQGGDLKVPL